MQSFALGVVGDQHPWRAAEVLEGVRLAVLPGPLPRVAEALRPEPVGERQNDGERVHLGSGTLTLSVSHVSLLVHYR